MSEYYQICLRHMRKNDNVFTFWGKNNVGYTKCIENAGLYENKNIDFKTQVEEGDFFVHKDTIENLMVKVRLPVYGEEPDTYCGLNEFLVLPNTGQVRKALGITILDIPNEGQNNSFNGSFKNTIKEQLKLVYSKTHYTVKGKKECFNEWWYYNTEVEAANKNKAIVKAQKEWFLDEYPFIEFKKMVTCSRTTKTEFDKWI